MEGGKSIGAVGRCVVDIMLVACCPRVLCASASYEGCRARFMLTVLLL